MKKILIVDDRTENRIMLSNYFKLFGSDAQIDIIQAGNSKTAVEMAFSQKPDLILMDIKLESDEAGLDATRKIKQNEETKNIPVWAVTAYAAVRAENSISAEEQKCYDAGCSEYILKPFEPAELLQKVSEQLNVPIPEEIIKRMKN